MGCSGSAITTAMNLRPPKLERRRRWLAPAALLAVGPKCVLCALAYAGLGSAFGLGGPELCGPPAASAHWPWLPVAAGTVMLSLHLILRPRTKP